MTSDAKRRFTALTQFVTRVDARRGLAATLTRARARSWAVGLLVALSLLAGAHTARAGERLVFDSFLGAKLVPRAVDPVSGITLAVDPLRDYDIPTGIAIDRRGVVYVADPLNNRVQVFNGSTVASLTSFCCITILDAGTGQVIATLHQVLNFPMGVAVDPRNDDVWIANTGARRLVKIDKNGQLLTAVGTQGTGLGQFESPAFIAVDPAGNVYVGDDGGIVMGAATVNPANIRMQKFMSDGTFVRSWGSFCNVFSMVGSCNLSAPGAVAVGDGQFSPISSVGVDSMGNVYVTEGGNARVQKFDTNGGFLLKWGTEGSGASQFNHPLGVAVDYADNVYVADFRNNRIQKFDGSGTFLTQVGAAGGGLGVFQGPFGIATMPKDLVQLCTLLGFQCQKIWVSEKTNKRVQVLEARPDSDNDSILDEVDLDPTNFSNEGGLGDTGAAVLNRGGPPFVVYKPTTGGVAPSTIRVTAETTGFFPPLSDDFDLFCKILVQPGVVIRVGTVKLVADNAFQFHCSTPTLEVLTGPIDWTFTAADGTVVTATLSDGNSLSVDPGTSSIRSSAGNLSLVVGGNTISLAPGQSVFADNTAPTTMAAASPGPNANGWNNADVTVKLTATDNSGGSGVKEIQFSLAGAQTGAGIVSGGVATVPISADGVTIVTYFARDDAGNQETARSLTIRMDKTPPVISGLPGPGCTLWPPNHRLVQVGMVTARDGLSGPAPASLGVTATSNEPPLGIGSGQASPDIVVTGTTVQLRAERSGTGTGRIYTVTATASDLAGNTATASAICTVPHDQRK